MIIMNNTLKQTCMAFMRYLLAGGLGFVIDYGALTLCYEILGIHYLISAIAGFSLGLVFVYISSNRWVFSKRRLSNKAWLEFLLFAIIGIIGLGLTVLFMYFFVDICGIHPLIAKLFTTFLVLLWNFGSRKVILYS